MNRLKYWPVVLVALMGCEDGGDAMPGSGGTGGSGGTPLEPPETTGAVTVATAEAAAASRQVASPATRNCIS